MSEHAVERKLPMSNAVYDGFRQAVLYWLPALATLYFALSQIWGFPYGEQIIGTIAAVEVFLAAAIGISRSSYQKTHNLATGEAFDGALVVDTTDGEVDRYNFDLAVPLSRLENMNTLTLKVKHEAIEPPAPSHE